ncbi:MAG: DUF1207 domain-containing protein [Planctomycetota bacterium]|jgi:hypothetical protein
MPASTTSWPNGWNKAAESVRRYLPLLALSATVMAADNGWIFAPADEIYPPYLADPRRPQTSAGEIIAFNSELIDDYDAGAARFALNVGERLRMLRWHGAGSEPIDIQVDAAIFAQFDQSHSLDNIGWDGWYAVHVARRMGPHLLAKAAYRHLSSHLGDEFIERTGRSRKGYTREDLTLGGAWTPPQLPLLCVYGEAGVAIVRSSDDQEPLMIQAGSQYRTTDRPLNGRWDWSLAIDSQWFEERDWQPNINMQAAVHLPSSASSARMDLVAGLYHGRVQVGELNELDESAVQFTFAYSW